MTTLTDHIELIEPMGRCADTAGLKDSHRTPVRKTNRPWPPSTRGRD
ncbi:hypothetical protein ABT013_19150 [Streptomyces bacillaris]|nr:hypothetical protein [Streptomyces sp. WAC04770]MYR36489.1 hypothetical protein [Streptomyces sp. SID4944]